VDTYGEPSYHPGCVRPINSGTEGQVKLGLLGLKFFQFLPGLTGSVTRGDVLTAMDTDGNVGWAPIPGTSASGIEVFDTSGTFVAPSGVTKVNVEVWSSGTLRGGGYAYKHGIPVSPGSSYSITVGKLGGASYMGSSYATSYVGADAGGAAGKGDFFIAGGRSRDGVGGSSPRGGSGAVITSTSASNPSWDYCSVAVAPGGGGVGTCDEPSSARNGAPGRVIVWY
jgi:hypothetical protein